MHKNIIMVFPFMFKNNDSYKIKGLTYGGKKEYIHGIDILKISIFYFKCALLVLD